MNAKCYAFITWKSKDSNEVRHNGEIWGNKYGETEEGRNSGSCDLVGSDERKMIMTDDLEAVPLMVDLSHEIWGC